MLKKLSRYMTALLCLAGCAPSPTPRAPQPGEVQHWAVYYHTKLSAHAFEGQDLVVFDRRYHPELKPLRDSKTELYAYISVGEVPGDVPEKKTLDAKGSLLSKNEKWNSYVVDTRSKEWRKIILGQVADAKEKGFNGVMLDTIDSPLHWAETHEGKKADAVRTGAIALIKAIRNAQPEMKIILNRGFDILPEVAKDIDFALAESILTQPGDSAGHFEYHPPDSYAQAVTQLQQVAAFAPHLQILTLDYWNQDDVAGILSIYDEQRANGFTPYVTTPDLHQFTPEPKLRRSPLRS